MKLMKKTLALAGAAVLCVAGVIGSSAATILYSSGCYYTIINNTRVSLTGWAGDGTIVRVPETLNNRRVTNIEVRAFYHDTVITGVDFSNASNLTTIGMYAFADCSAYSEPLVLPESITSIGDCAFEGTPVPEVEINATTDYIPIQCFYNNDTLTQVTINGPIEEIDNYAFANCQNLEAIYLPQTVTVIADSAFDNDPNLTIYCYEDSYAQQYAQEKNIPYVLIGNYEIGDVDRDGAITVTDVTLIQKYLAELATLDADQLLLADYLSDGEVNIADATAIQIAIAD